MQRRQFHLAAAAAVAAASAFKFLRKYSARTAASLRLSVSEGGDHNAYNGLNIMV